jgi:hypothetical protein
MSVASHLAGKDPTVRATYQRLIDVARTLGPVTEEVKNFDTSGTPHRICRRRDAAFLPHPDAEIRDRYQ